MITHLAFFLSRDGKVPLGLLIQSLNVGMIIAHIVFLAEASAMKWSCSSPLQAYVAISLALVVFLTILGVVFVYSEYVEGLKLVLFHFLGSIYFCITIGGCVLISAAALQPGPNDPCKLYAPHLFWFCVALTIMNFSSVLFFCPFTCMHALFCTCGSMSCPQGQGMDYRQQRSDHLENVRRGNRQ